LKLIFTLFPVALSNIGTSVPMTSGSGPPPATTLISAAFALLAKSALKQPATAAATNLDHAFMTTPSMMACEDDPITRLSLSRFNSPGNRAAAGLASMPRKRQVNSNVTWAWTLSPGYADAGLRRSPKK
jgi:hypothetical protein